MLLRYHVTDRHEAWDFIRALAADWSRPLDDQDGCTEAELADAESRLGRRLPPAVIEAYRLVGRRDDLTRTQDRLLRPAELKVEDDRWLVYRYENQGCALWAVDLARPDDTDPPTWWRNPTTASSAWRPFLDRFSQACVEMVLSEHLIGAPGWHDNRQLDAPSLGALEAWYQPLGFPEYEFWALPDRPPVRWFTADDVLLREDGRDWLWVIARTEAALNQVRSTLPGDWLMVPDPAGEK